MRSPKSSEKDFVAALPGEYVRREADTTRRSGRGYFSIQAPRTGLTQSDTLNLTQRRCFLFSGLACLGVPAAQTSSPSAACSTSMANGLSGAVVDRNSKLADILQRATDRSNTDRSKTKSNVPIYSSESQAEGKADDCKDSLKLLATALEAAERDLRCCWNGVSLNEDFSGQDAAAASAKKNMHIDEDDRELERERLLQKLLVYRFKRKISDPPPPLEPLSEDEFERLPVGTDKIERNRRKSRLGWLLTTSSRAKKANREKERRFQESRLRSERSQQCSTRMQAPVVSLEVESEQTWAFATAGL